MLGKCTAVQGHAEWQELMRRDYGTGDETPPCDHAEVARPLWHDSTNGFHVLTYLCAVPSLTVTFSVFNGLHVAEADAALLLSALEVILRLALSEAGALVRSPVFL